MADIMPYGARPRIEAAGIPIFSIYGWFDAGLAFSGLAHYQNFSNPQVVLMGPFSHGGLFDADPFRPADAPAEPDHDEQMKLVTDFFDDFVKGREGATPERTIRYFTLGADTWRTTSVWPPSGLETVSYFFGEGQSAGVAPAGSGTDTLHVDFTTGSGALSRYRSIVAATDIVYPRRSEDTSKLLHYDTEPMTADMELTGSPIAELYVSSTREDGAFYAYVDDVSPEGEVTYLTEGVLRGLFHKTSSRPGPYRTFGVERAYWKEDAEPMEPGTVYRLEIEMFPVSALVRRGHRLRFSLSGADADAMPRIPAEGPAPQVTVFRTPEEPSRIFVPMAPFEGGNGASP
jgi:putative CocE/NonD family hydrolase